MFVDKFRQLALFNFVLRTVPLDVIPELFGKLGTW
jgi:hypothetical protein